MPTDRWRERAALKAATRERVRALGELPLPAFLAEAERAAEEARAFLEREGAPAREGRLPGSRTGFARLYRDAHRYLQEVAAFSFALDEEDPFHLFGATTDRVRRAFPFLADEDARRFVIRKLHDFTAPVEPDLPMRGALANALFEASESYHRLAALKLRKLNDPYERLADLVSLLGRYAPAYAGVPEAEVGHFLALPLEKRLSLLEGTGALGRRSS